MNPFAGDEEESNPIVPGLHRDLLAALEENERAVFRRYRERRIPPADPFGRDSEPTE